MSAQKITTTLLTVKKARALGYDVTRGGYVGTSDDNADRWYIDSATTCERRGAGFRTRREALEYLTDNLRTR